MCESLKVLVERGKESTNWTPKSIDLGMDVDINKDRIGKRLASLTVPNPISEESYIYYFCHHFPIFCFSSSLSSLKLVDSASEQSPIYKMLLEDKKETDLSFMVCGKEDKKYSIPLMKNQRLLETITCPHDSWQYLDIELKMDILDASFDFLLTFLEPPLWCSRARGFF